MSITTRASANDYHQLGVCRLLDFFNTLGEITAGGVIKTRSSHWRASGIGVNTFIIDQNLSWHEDLESARIDTTGFHPRGIYQRFRGVLMSSRAFCRNALR